MFSALLVAATLCWVDSQAIVSDLAPGRRETVSGTVAEMIRLLESRQYQRLVEECAHPSLLREVENEQLMELVVQVMTDRSGPQMLAALRKFDESKLEYNADHTEAVFQIPPPTEDLETMKFGKHQGRWYVLE